MPLAGLAAALGSRDKSRPLRPLQRHIGTAVLFGLVSVQDQTIRLTYRGYCVQRGEAAAVGALRAAFAAEDLPRRVCKQLTIGMETNRENASERLSVLGEAGNLGAWIQWLQSAGMLVEDGAMLKMTTPGTPFCIDAFDQSSYRPMERELYVRLLRDSPISGNPSGELNPSVLDELGTKLRKARDKDAEDIMRQLLQVVFRTLGFEVQRSNGAREAGDGDFTRLHFGSEGDDLAALFLRSPLALAESLDGWVISAEAKAGDAPKKAVTQALAFSERVAKAFGGRVVALPVAISGRPVYSNRIAKEYARDASVVHLPLEGLVRLAKQQWVRHRDPDASLITPPALLSFIEFARRVGYVEPTPDELAAQVARIATCRAANWLFEEAAES